MFTNQIYLIYLNKQDLILNNQQWLICQKPNRQKGSILVQDLTNQISKLTKTLSYYSHLIKDYYLGWWVIIRFIF